MTNKISLWLYYVSAVIAIGFGSIYFFGKDLMQYHYAYMNMWPDNEGAVKEFNMRTYELMVAFKNIIGACLIGIGVGALFMNYLHSKTNLIVGNIGIFLLLFLPNAELLYISYGVAHSISKGPKPPWQLSVVALLLLVVALVLGFVKKKE